MKRLIISLTFLILGFLSACKSEVIPPEVTELSSPEAVALSLSTVNPDEQIYLFDYDPDAPLDIQEERRWHESRATWIDFTYASPKGGRVPARLVIPDGKGPFPGIIIQHGGPGTLEDVVDFARAFARYGAVSIMITSPYRRPGGWELTQYMGNTWPIFNYRDVEIKIQLINDLQRAVDILQERPEVDPDRMAFFGLSWGGSMGGLFAGIETRLKAYVLVVGDGGLVEHTADPGEDGLNIHFSEKWANYMWPTEPLHFVGRAAPAALLFQNGLHDTYVLPHDAIRFYTAASEPKTIMWYEAGHGLPWSFVQDAAEWLQPYVGDPLIFLKPNYRPSAIIWEWGIIILMGVSVVVYLVDAFKRKDMDWMSKLIWFLAIIPLGPVALIFYWLFRFLNQKASSVGHQPNARLNILIITIYSTLLLTISFFIGDMINVLISGADFRLRFIQLYLTSLVFYFLLSSLIKSAPKQSLVSKFLLVNLFWVCGLFFPTLIARFINLPSWLLHIQVFLSGFLITLPVHAWLVNARMETLGIPDVPKEKIRNFHKILAVVFLACSFVVMLGSVVYVVQVYSDLPWRDAIAVILGTYI